MSNAVEQITQLETSTGCLLSAVFKEAFHDTLAARGQIDPRLYEVEGFCGRKFRLLLHNLVRRLDGSARYLEVGVYKGATLCPVIADNVVDATAIDNWSWDKENHVAKQMYRNIAEFKGATSTLTLIEADFLEVPHTFSKNFNMYFYDGDHSYQSQYDGIAWALPNLDESAIILVDDWNWQQVRSGTMNALRDTGVQIDYMVELRTSFDDQIPTPAYGTSEWHNGFFGAVVSKTKTSSSFLTESLTR